MSHQNAKLKSARLMELVASPKDDIVDGPFGSRLKATEYVDEGVPIVRLQNIDRNRFIDKNIKFITREKAKEISRHHFVSGDILISKLGDPLGEACIAPEHLSYGILVADVVRVRPNTAKVDTNFLAYALNSEPVAAQFKAETKGTTRPRVNLQKVRDLNIPFVDSLREQRRIVAEIEKQFTRLEAGVTALRRVQANLKRYRTAVLKAACEGKLVPTEVELRKGAVPGVRIPREVETGEQLLERILAERRKNWNGKGKHKEPPFPSPSDFERTELPVGWTATYLQPLLNIDRSGMKTGPFGSLLKKHEHRAQGIPVLGIENISNLKFVPGNKIFIEPAKAAELASYDVLAGEILISRSGTVGEVCSVPEGLGEARISCNLMRVSLRPDGILSNFFCILFNGSPSVLRQVSDLCKGSTRDFLNQHILHSIIFPLPPLAEQTRIVAEVERRLSVVEELESVVSDNLQRATRLRQSILQKAFTGELV